MVIPSTRAAIATSLLLGLVQLGLADAPSVVPQPLTTPTPATLNHVEEFRDAVTRAHHTSTEAHNMVVLAQLVGIYHRKPPSGHIASLAVSDATSIRIVERPEFNPMPPRPRR